MNRNEVTLVPENDGVRIGVWMTKEEHELVTLRAEWARETARGWIVKAGIAWDGLYSDDIDVEKCERCGSVIPLTDEDELTGR